jgi:hypothetical protein
MFAGILSNEPISLNIYNRPNIEKESQPSIMVNEQGFTLYALNITNVVVHCLSLLVSDLHMAAHKIEV